jgi:hypothetical protein
MALQKERVSLRKENKAKKEKRVSWVLMAAWHRTE